MIVRGRIGSECEVMLLGGIAQGIENAAWLHAGSSALRVKRGDPVQVFGKIDQDQEGRVSIDWGVTGVPETFVIDGKGVIRVHYAHPLDDDVVNRLIMPALK